VQFYTTVIPPADVLKLARNEVIPGLTALLNIPREQRTAAQQSVITRYFLNSIDETAKQLRTSLATVEQRRTELDKLIPTALVMEDIPQPRTSHLLDRGRYDAPGEVVTAGTPASLPAMPADLPTNRLGLAKWLIAPEHPLTSRVAVNRWWALVFGSGLVESEEDFGVQGTNPSHPDLLDWLAVEYAHPTPNGLGWDTKALLKLIVTSATYRQASHVTPALLELDPHNRLLGRGPRYRLSAEQIRDNALVASGLLIEHLGGPSVKPYQPAGLWEEVSVERRFKYVPETGEGLYRRSLYTYWKRTCAPPGMTTIDAPDREFCVIRRARTNTPLQALLLLNDVTYVEASRKLAERILLEAGADFDSRLAHACRLVLARTPRADESKVLRQIHDFALQKFLQDPAAAEKLLGVGNAERSATADLPELAAWATVACVLLNLDETLSKE